MLIVPSRSRESHFVLSHCTVFKVKLCLYPPLEYVLGEGVWRHSFLNSDLGGCGWLTSHPGRFTSGEKTGYPLNRKLGGPYGRSGQSWRRENIFLSHYSDAGPPITWRVTIPTPHILILSYHLLLILKTGLLLFSGLKHLCEKNLFRQLMTW